MISTAERRIRKIVIVGGGTAGWLSAAYLNRALSVETDITVVESSAARPIGVGEASLPTLRHTFDFLGMKEKDWMPACNATYKMAIRFDGWLEGNGERYYHSFVERSHGVEDSLIRPYERPFFPEVGQGFSLAHYWLKKKLAGEPVGQYADLCLSGPALCDANKSPRLAERPDLSQPYAYHVDAGLVADYLKQLACSRGVRHVLGHVDAVNKAQDGSVQSVTMRNGQTLQGDLFIDCSGFRSLLLGEALQEPLVSDSQALLCDSAVTISADNCPERRGIRPYTIATAQRSGWSWDVPLFHRNGTGYVYSSDFVEADEAEAELRAFLGPRAQSRDAQHIKMRVGKRRDVWVKNCVAVGLSGSFLEPLESTSIFMSEFQLAQLITFFPDREFSPARRLAYNQVIQNVYEDMRDFIVLHYVLSKRRDTAFWRAATTQERISISLRERLELYNENLPVHEQLSIPVFRNTSFTQVLAGMNRLPSASYPILDHCEPVCAQQALQRAAAKTAAALAGLPDHYTQLVAMRAAPESR